MARIMKEYFSNLFRSSRGELKRRIGKKRSFALKLDMSKAYDKAEWGFLYEVLLKMGFESEWVDLIMTCISSMSYSVFINGKMGGEFKPTRDLRRDPLTLYLFLICGKGLSKLMKMTKEERRIKSVKERMGDEEIVEEWNGLENGEEAEAILQIPLVRHLRDECRVWNEEPTGEYTDRVNSKIPGQRIGEERWRPPGFSKVKINFNTTFEKQSNISGTDIVCRESKGVILGSKIMVNLCVPTLFAANALACLQAV
ncbi:hypothetical protein Gogos_003274 [Gossypium gossypioides]|uniref:Reverse transcriptase domain-containing protein n=1 Tax=Gossypium gossypioides TaxID=34282 RepID=A0A7J9CLI1_GOSGO|nr:hypothetical protein [Gossypium gossypioides]